MNSKEGTGKELLIGFDLCNDYSQISYFNFDLKDPKTVSTAAGEERFLIPSVILKKGGMDKWYFGEEAIKKATEEDILIRDLLDKCSEENSIELEGEKYEASYLLELFLKKTLGFLTYEGLGSKIPDYIVFTLRSVNDKIAKVLRKAAIHIGIPEQNIYIQDHQESFVEYTIHQKNELWNHHVVLLEFEKDYLTSCKLKINTQTSPITATVSKESFTHIKPLEIIDNENNESIKEKQEQLDRLVREELKKYFSSSVISCVFLCGDGFDGEWAKETLRFLCSGRRVFQGKNLYSKGACYLAARKAQDAEAFDYLFLSDNKLKYNIGLDVIDKGEKKYFSLLTAGVNWYEASKDCELILDDESCVELKLIPMDKKDIRTVIINLHDLPDRPNGTIRVRLQVKFESANKGIVIVSDLGFGEIYFSSNKVWKHEIIL